MEKGPWGAIAFAVIAGACFSFILEWIFAYWLSRRMNIQIKSFLWMVSGGLVSAFVAFWLVVVALQITQVIGFEHHSIVWAPLIMAVIVRLFTYEMVIDEWLQLPFKRKLQFILGANLSANISSALLAITLFKTVYN